MPRKLAVILLACLLASASPASATTASGVYHPAEDINPGTFASGGAFTFPNQLNVVQNFAVDTNSLFVDSANHRVGIGTTSPSQLLTINGNGLVTLGNSLYFGDTTKAIRNTSSGLEITATNTVPVIISGTAGLKINNGPLDINNNLILNGKLGTNLDTNGYNVTGLGALVFNNGLVVNGPIQNQNASQNGGNVYVADNLEVTGSVGIGVAAPSDTLTVNGNLNLTGFGHVIKDVREIYGQTSQGAVDFNLFVRNSANNAWVNGLRIAVGNADNRMTIDGSGNVGIGTTNPETKLDVRGDVQLIGDSPSVTHLLLKKFSSTNTYDRGNLGFYKARGTKASPTAVQSGDHAWSIEGSGYDGSSFDYLGGINMKTTGISSGVVESELNFDTAGSTAGTGVTRMTINKDGKVGVGTTAPNARLHLKANSADGDIELLTLQGYSGWDRPAIQGKNATGDSLWWAGTGWSGNTDKAFTLAADAGEMHLLTDDSGGIARRRVTIDVNGNVGIGTSDPASYDDQADQLVLSRSGNNGLTIAAGTTSNSAVYFADGSSGSSTNVGRVVYDHNTDSMAFFTQGSEKVKITSSGNVGIGTTNPGAYKLYVNGDAYIAGITMTNGNLGFGGDLDMQNHNITNVKRIGIGTTNPTTQLEVKGAPPLADGHIKIVGVGQQARLMFYQDATSAGGIGGTTSDIRIIGDTGKEITFWPANTQQVVFATSGNVGIGTASPGSKLDVSGNVNVYQGTNNVGLTVDTNDQVVDPKIYLRNTQSRRAKIAAAYGLGVETPINTEVFSISNTGNVGIGTTSPGEKLDVVGTIRAQSGASASESHLRMYATTASGFTGIDSSKTGTGAILPLVFQMGGVEKMRLDTSGNLGIGTNAPYNLLEVRQNTAPASKDIAVIYTKDDGAQITPTNLYGSLKISNEWSGSASGANAKLAKLMFHTNTDNGWNAWGSIFLDANSGSASNKGNLKFATADASQNLATRMTIDGNGNIGIGTTNPQNTLHLDNSAGPVIRLTRTGFAPIFTLEADGSTGVVKTTTAHALTLGTNNAERMRIDSSGNVGIGTTGPASGIGAAPVLNLNGAKPSIRFDATQGGSTGVEIFANDTGLTFQQMNSNRNFAFLGGNVGIGTTSPTAKLNIATDSGVEFRFSGTGNANLYSTTGNDFYIGTTDTGKINFRTADADRVTIDSVGNVGIGTPSPQYTLDVPSGPTRFFAGFSTYTTDGVWSANAKPSRFSGPGSGFLNFGYTDTGGGQYIPSLGFSGPSGIDTGGYYIIQTRLSTGTGADTSNRYQVRFNGRQDWGPGNAATDTSLYRAGNGILATDGQFSVGTTLQIGASDVQLSRSGTNTLALPTSMIMLWGGDTNIYRGAADTLKTDDSLHVAGNIRITTNNNGIQDSAGTSRITFDATNSNVVITIG